MLLISLKEKYNLWPKKSTPAQVFFSLVTLSFVLFTKLYEIIWYFTTKTKENKQNNFSNKNGNGNNFVNLSCKIDKPLLYSNPVPAGSWTETDTNFWWHYQFHNGLQLSCYDVLSKKVLKSHGMSKCDK